VCALKTGVSGKVGFFFFSFFHERVGFKGFFPPHSFVRGTLSNVERATCARAFPLFMETSTCRRGEKRRKLTFFCFVAAPRSVLPASSSSVRRRRRRRHRRYPAVGTVPMSAQTVFASTFRDEEKRRKETSTSDRTFQTPSLRLPSSLPSLYLTLISLPPHPTTTKHIKNNG
jgi:hypothetical protein